MVGSERRPRDFCWSRFLTLRVMSSQRHFELIPGSAKRLSKYECGLLAQRIKQLLF